MQLNPYLNFNGNCKEAFELYAKVLGGKIVAMLTHAEMPGGDKLPKDQQARIMHARMTIGDEVLMASDSPVEHYQVPRGISVSINVSDPDEADRIFHGLEQGGTVQLAIQETFWAKRFGMLVDRFGIPWMINCEKPMQ